MSEFHCWVGGMSEYIAGWGMSEYIAGWEACLSTLLGGGHV